MIPEERIDAALESVLRASGSSLSLYKNVDIVNRMRASIREIMSDSYIKGSNDCYAVMKQNGIIK